jgi:hypothetical protein
MVLATDFLRQMDAPLPVSILCSNKQEEAFNSSGGGGNSQSQGQGQGQGSGSSNMSIEQQVIIHSYSLHSNSHFLSLDLILNFHLFSIIISFFPSSLFSFFVFFTYFSSYYLGDRSVPVRAVRYGPAHQGA